MESIISDFDILCLWLLDCTERNRLLLEVFQFLHMACAHHHFCHSCFLQATEYELLDKSRSNPLCENDCRLLCARQNHERCRRLLNFHGGIFASYPPKLHFRSFADSVWYFFKVQENHDVCALDTSNSWSIFDAVWSELSSR